MTFALAYSIKSMMGKACLVCTLTSCETLGGVTAVCTDKTGALTTRTMSVVQGLLAELEFVIDHYGVTVRGDHVKVYCRTRLRAMDATPESIDIFCFSVSVNSTLVATTLRCARPSSARI